MPHGFCGKRTSVEDVPIRFKTINMNSSTSKVRPCARDEYFYHIQITTRWMDNDLYGHVNNVIYYSWIDTVVNQWLIENGLLKSDKNPSIGWVAHSECNYFSHIAYPSPVVLGLKLAHMGNSSVHYDVGIFVQGALQPSAQGKFVHVYVDPLNHRPMPLSQAFKHTLETLI